MDQLSAMITFVAYVLSIFFCRHKLVLKRKIHFMPNCICYIYICVCVCMCAHIYMPQFRFLQVQHYPLELELSSVGHSDMKSLITRYNFTGWTRWLPRSSSWTGGRAKPKNDALKLSIVLLWIEYQMKLFGSFSLAIKLLHFPFLFSADFCMN